MSEGQSTSHKLVLRSCKAKTQIPREKRRTNLDLFYQINSPLSLGYIITNGLVTSADERPRLLLKACLFSTFPCRSVALYWTGRNASVAGFHASVSIPLRIPMNFLEWE